MRLKWCVLHQFRVQAEDRLTSTYGLQSCPDRFLGRHPYACSEKPSRYRHQTVQLLCHEASTFVFGCVKWESSAVNQPVRLVMLRHIDHV